MYTRAEDEAALVPEGPDDAGTGEYNNCWYVVHCQPMKEEFAATVLRDSMGLDTYLPQVTESSSRKMRPVAFFPGYLFVQANLQEVNLSSINSTPGVLRLLQQGDEPRPLPAALIEALRERVDMLNAEGGLPKYRFQPGDQVWLRSGPLRGLQAVFLGPMPARARVRVLLEFLGRPNEVQVDADAIEPAMSNPEQEQEPEPRRERTTRGRGRRIKSGIGRAGGPAVTR